MLEPGRHYYCLFPSFIRVEPNTFQIGFERIYSSRRPNIEPCFCFLFNNNQGGYKNLDSYYSIKIWRVPLDKRNLWASWTIWVFIIASRKAICAELLELELVIASRSLLKVGLDLQFEGVLQVLNSLNTNTTIIIYFQ